MNFVDMIKKSVIEQFTLTISGGEIFLSLLVALLAVLIIIFLYRKTYMGVSYVKSFALSIVLLAMVTSLVIKTISSNLALSLGMVGALSIVRFRTSIKDPIDTMFMFWAITIGIMSGAGLYLITLVATLILGIFYLISHSIIFKPLDKYLLVIRINKTNSVNLIGDFKNKKKCVLKTQSVIGDMVELTYEISDKEISAKVLELQKKYSLESINLVSIN